MIGNWIRGQIRIIIGFFRRMKVLNINWYPGHMVKTKRQIEEDIKLIDVVLEILDARIPISSQNPDIKQIIKNKKRIILLNKSDLSDKTENVKWVKYFKSQGIPAVLTNSNTGSGIKEVLKEIENIMEDDMKKNIVKGRVGKQIRTIILGIPNVGKSSLINKITNKKSAEVGNKPGVTKQKQWVHLSNKIDLLDTPGVLWPRFENEEVALNLSFVGTIKEENIDKTELAYQLIKRLEKDYLGNILNRYKIEEQEYMELEKEQNRLYSLMELIGRKRGALLPGNKVDVDKTAGVILDEFRSAKLGNITLETVNV